MMRVEALSKPLKKYQAVHTKSNKFVVGQFNGSNHTQVVRAGTLKPDEKIYGWPIRQQTHPDVELGLEAKFKIVPNCIARGLECQRRTHSGKLRQPQTANRVSRGGVSAKMP